MADNPSLDNNDDLADIEAMLRDLDVADLELVEPPAEVWAGIDTRTRRRDRPSRRIDRDTNVVSLAHRRRNRFLAPALGIAAAAVLAVAGIAVFNGRGGSEPDVIASAVLEFDAGFDQLGSDRICTGEPGRRRHTTRSRSTMRTLPDPTSEDADLELWLIEVDSTTAASSTWSRSCRSLDGTEPGTFRCRTGYDPAVYTVVDISVEPHDGNDDHSGRSILRGALQQA